MWNKNSHTCEPISKDVKKQLHNFEGQTSLLLGMVQFRSYYGPLKYIYRYYYQKIFLFYIFPLNLDKNVLQGLRLTSENFNIANPYGEPYR